MFNFLAACFLGGTVLMVGSLMFLGWQQWCIDRRETEEAKPADVPQPLPVPVKAPV